MTDASPGKGSSASCSIGADSGRGVSRSGVGTTLDLGARNVTASHGGVLGVKHERTETVGGLN